MDILKSMQVFVEVANAGSFVTAADRMETSSASVSRQVSTLEDHLGARLMQRTTRRIALTEPGQYFYERAQKILADIAETEAVVGQHMLKPKGQLRLSAPLSFGTRVLSNLLPEFSRRYPDLTLNIELRNKNFALVDEGIDVGILIARDINLSLIVRKIASIDMIVCAAPSYLDNFGRPQHPSDLVLHKILRNSSMDNEPNWTFQNVNGNKVAVPINPHFIANSGDLLGNMSRAGLGIAVQPDFLVMEDIRKRLLEPLLPDWALVEYGIYVTYVSRKYLAPKIRVFIDYLSESLGILCKNKLRIEREWYASGRRQGTNQG